MTSISIGARTFGIQLRRSDPVLDANPRAQSYTDHMASLIVVRDDPSFSRDAREELLVHELLHVIIKNAGLHECLREGFTEEFVVSALAPRLHALLKELGAVVPSMCA